MPPRRTLRGALIRLAALLAGLAPLAGVEAVCRALPEPGTGTDGVSLRPHPTRIWSLVPEEQAQRFRFHVTDDGLRRPDHQGPADAPLILTTGDSSIFGEGIDDGDTIHDVLADTLTLAGQPVRVGTLAVLGYSTVQTRVVLDEVGWAMKPDLLVVANLWSDEKLDLFRDSDLLASQRSASARLEWGLSRLALFRHLRAGLNGLRGLPSTRIISWPRLGTEQGIRRVPLPDYLHNLETILDGARERNTGVVFLTLVHRDILRHGLRQTDSWTPYVRAQQEVARTHGVPVLDLATLLAGQDAKVVLRDELHPSEVGAFQIGQALARLLRDRGWPANRLVPHEGTPVPPPDDPFDGHGRTAPVSSVLHRL